MHRVVAGTRAGRGADVHGHRHGRCRLPELRRLTEAERTLHSERLTRP